MLPLCAVFRLDKTNNITHLHPLKFYTVYVTNFMQNNDENVLAMGQPATNSTAGWRNVAQWWDIFWFSSVRCRRPQSAVLMMSESFANTSQHQVQNNFGYCDLCLNKSLLLKQLLSTCRDFEMLRELCWTVLNLRLQHIHCFTFLINVENHCKAPQVALTWLSWH